MATNEDNVKYDGGNGLYKQCRLKQDNKEYVAWIPAKAARVGKTLLLEDKEGEWKVTEVYGMVERSTLDEQRSAQKRFEKVLK